MTTFGVTRSKARALEAFSVGTIQLSAFAVFLEVKPRTARETLAKLISDDLVKLENKEAKSYALTESGRGALLRKAWKCVYCRKDFFDKRHRPGEESCRTCRNLHLICRSCLKLHAIVGGEFPSWKVTLRACPSGVSGETVQAEEAKETAQAAAQDGPP